ncbi:MAG: YopX family protein, partial [Desulfotomaculaceae bacterium]|nr:YopX family protein [Desulfotomaculaceae bacterium]
NGKEIYEGDIFRSSLGVVAVVEWEREGRFLGFTVGSERKIVYINREPAVEVIGTIHENSDLLK